jgi:hypothetical protein
VVVVDEEQDVRLRRQPRLIGLYASKIGAHTGSSCFFLSYAKPMVGVCELAMAPTILAMMRVQELKG